MGVRYCIGVLCDGSCDVTEEEGIERELWFVLVYIEIWRNDLIDLVVQFCCDECKKWFAFNMAVMK